MASKPKILWGVCGIGRGHTFRQLPLIEHFSSSAEIVIFGYNESYSFLSSHFKDNPQVCVQEVAVPFLVGCKEGIDFQATAKRPENQKDFTLINNKAMSNAQEKINKPTLVISDYEPISAQYSYAHNTPLITLDQQSKFLSGQFPAELNNQTFNDEIMRLNLFFPKADKRLATSFFKVAKKSNAQDNVEILPPVLSENITSLKRQTNHARKSILVYISSQQPFGQSLPELTHIFSKFPDIDFHLFGKNVKPMNTENVKTYEHGHKDFHSVLSHCSGIISTAGHTLLSEAMHLGIPVYAIPLPLYEQQMNANIIEQGQFGISYPNLNDQSLLSFIQKLDHFGNNIETDTSVLLRTPGQKLIIEHLEQYL